ncbi:S8 family peptidase [Burkholderia ubonensis]|uniref:S8 family peptidase n=1 Tax=Burkholderia ubonensis TaxID=101571 RepID=UPI0009B471BD|nr:S8 family peptidase [Burkholderia ubonensis]
MAREHNYLLGNGERLAKPHSIDMGSRPKQPPYPFPVSRDRLTNSVKEVAEWAKSLPQDACPNDEIVAEVVLHPRYISKSDQPNQLFAAVGLRAVGRKSIEVSPDEWGVSKHPNSAATDKVFVAVKRTDMLRWSDELATWTEAHPAAAQLTQIERIRPFTADAKLIDVPADGNYVAEVVLHNAGDRNMMDAFVGYAARRHIGVLHERRRVVGGLTFLPVRMSASESLHLAQFSFVRVVRSMPHLRSVGEGPVRTYLYGANLPNVDAASPEYGAVIFDGGIPDDVEQSFARWVRVVEPPGIGAPSPAFQLHGLAVTSSFLFGPLEGGHAISRPPCRVDHVRVLDESTGSDFEYYDVLERITNHLDTVETPYKFGCISLGPSRPITDDEITAWTAEIDARLAHGNMLLAVAAGNDGDLDPERGANRIQPPSDGVNIFSVGAADSRNKRWQRAPYSCVGPGRIPGLFKPDGLAFGGTDAHPFEVVGPGLFCLGLTGTSFAAPFGLRSCAGVSALLEVDLHPLTIRALAVHKAEHKRGHPHSEVGWGRFLEDPSMLITCDDCEAVVVYEGDLPMGEHLRARLAVPDTPLIGKVRITATLAIAPEVDPEHASTYTRGGLSVMFRPNAARFELNDEGKCKKEPETANFFNAKRLSGRLPEYVLRKDAHKWEPVIRASREIDATELSAPFFDIYYNRRERGGAQKEPTPLRYALVVTVRCEGVPNLYEQTLATHLSVLTPLQPRVAVTLRV